MILCVVLVEVYQFVLCASYPFGSDCNMWYLIVLIFDLCLSFNFYTVTNIALSQVPPCNYSGHV